MYDSREIMTLIYSATDCVREPIVWSDGPGSLILQESAHSPSVGKRIKINHIYSDGPRVKHIGIDLVVEEL